MNEMAKNIYGERRRAKAHFIRDVSGVTEKKSSYWCRIFAIDSGAFMFLTTSPVGG